MEIRKECKACYNVFGVNKEDFEKIKGCPFCGIGFPDYTNTPSWRCR